MITFSIVWEGFGALSICCMGVSPLALSQVTKKCEKILLKVLIKTAISLRHYKVSRLILENNCMLKTRHLCLAWQQLIRGFNTKNSLENIQANSDINKRGGSRLNPTLILTTFTMLDVWPFFKSLLVFSPLFSEMKKKFWLVTSRGHPWGSEESGPEW